MVGQLSLFPSAMHPSSLHPAHRCILYIFVTFICHLGFSQSAETRLFVKNGELLSAIQSGVPWTLRNGYIENAGTGRFLYGSQGLASGDWVVRARLSIQQLNGSAASLMLAGVNNLILDGAAFKITLEGAIWGSQGVIGDSRDYITPGQAFEVTMERAGATLTIKINDRILAQRLVNTNVFGTVALRPHRSTMRVYEFSAEGHLTGFLPKPTLFRTTSMPTLDYSGRRDWQTVVSAGTDTLYNGHPTTLRVPETGAVYAVWTLGHGGTVYFLKRSLDDGATWSDNLPVPANWALTYNCPTIHRLTAPDGRERLFVFAGARAMFQSYSEDGGETWTSMRTNGLTCVVAPMSVLPVQGGKLRMWYHRGFNDTDTPPLALWQAESTDGGLTWNNQRKILEMTGADPCEPAVVRSPDGTRLLMLIRENQHYLNSLYMLSEDEGATWSRPQELPGDLTGDRHVARYAADGRLLIAFRDTSVTTMNSYGNLTLWVGDFDDIIGGTKGQYRVKLLHNMGGGIDSGYPGLEVLADGSVLATTYVRYNSAAEKPSIVCTRLDLAAADAAVGVNDEQEGPPVFLSQPLPREFPEGANVTLRTTVAGAAPFSYQWYFNDAPIPGANTQNYNIPSIRSTDEGGYHVLVSNAEGAISSQPVDINVWLPSTAILSVDRRSAFPGQSITFTASSNGTPPFRYIWMKDGMSLAITSTEQLIIPSAKTDTAGNYSVRVENYGSEATTEPLFVGIFGGESIRLAPVPDTDRLLLSGERLAPNRNYQVEVSTNLTHWQASGRTIGTDEHGEFQAEVAMVGSQRFWRLVLE